MPRRRHHHHHRRRLEWSKSMESMVTLVEGSPATPRPGANVSAEARPGLLRSAGSGSAPSALPAVADASEATQLPASSDDVLPAPQNPLMTRSHSEQTTASSGEESGAKMQVGFGQRVRESLKRRLRLISDAILLTHLHESAQGIDGYYAVSMA
ncbi:hypothetical protein GGF42_003576 [Coemansia sp. RSA 2424]|nr:hypothetical protein GGF42_003576 [Coemansia sp. RSA 2424]